MNTHTNTFQNNNLSIEELLSEIETNEKNHGVREALPPLFHYLHSSLRNKDYNAIEQLINHDAIFTLKIIHLITILNITYKYRNSIPSYSVFIEATKEKAKLEMTERNFELTFKNFNL